MDSGNDEQYQKCKKVIDAFYRYQFDLSRPYNFDPKKPDCIITDIDLNFGYLITSLEECNVVIPEKFSLYDLNVKLSYFEAKMKNSKHKPGIE